MTRTKRSGPNPPASAVDASADAARWLSIALDCARLAMWEWDGTSDRMVWSEEFYALLGYGRDAIAPGREAWLSRVHPDDAAALGELLQPAGRDGRDFDVAFRVMLADGTTRWCRTRGRADPDGRVAGAAEDVTELVLARERQRRLQHDLLHRVRNILGVIRSIVLRTADTSQAVGEFADHLEARIDTLARLQSVLLQSPDGASLRGILLEELRKAAAGREQVRLDGPDVALPPRVAQTMCLAIHELTTNTVKYGALTQPDGRLGVSWSIGNKELRLHWNETGVSLPAPPARRGFGMSLLEDVLPYELGASVESEFSREGFRCSITVPLSRS